MTPSGPTLARFDRPAGPKTRLAVVADPHLTDAAEGSWKVYHRTVERFMSVIADVNQSAIDGLLVAGDLTKDGHPGEFQLARELLATLEVPYVAVPGNHDVPKAVDEHATPPVQRFERRFGPGPYPTTRRIGSVDVVAVDTATHPDGQLRDGSEGVVTEAERAAVGTELGAATRPIVLGHHNLFSGEEQRGSARIETLHDPLRNRHAFLSLLAEQNVSLAFTGHNHWPGVATRDGLAEVASPATCSLPQSYLLVTIEPRGTTVELIPLADKLALEEAYQYARAGTRRSRAIADAFHDGYVGELPLVDERRSQPLAGSAPAALERLLH